MSNQCLKVSIFPKHVAHRGPTLSFWMENVPMPRLFLRFWRAERGRCAYLAVMLHSGNSRRKDMLLCWILESLEGKTCQCLCRLPNLRSVLRMQIPLYRCPLHQPHNLCSYLSWRATVSSSTLLCISILTGATFGCSPLKVATDSSWPSSCLLLAVVHSQGSISLHSLQWIYMLSVVHGHLETLHIVTLHACSGCHDALALLTTMRSIERSGLTLSHLTVSFVVRTSLNDSPWCF